VILYVLKRLLWGIPVVITVATLTFAILQVVPGGPFDTEKALPPEIKANVEAKYYLDRPLWEQYARYLMSVLGGDLGPSYKYVGRTVNDIIRDTLPVSVQLGLLAVGFSLILGIGAGIVSAVWRRSWADYASMFVATAGISIPTFVLGALMIALFAFQWRLFPPALWEGWRYMVLPSITLALLPAAYLARLTRSSLLETLQAEFIRVARSKGIGEGGVILKHTMANSLSPVVTFVGPLVAALITGSFVVEYMFSVPGMGRFFITAVTNRDYPLIMGVTLVYTVLIVLANIVVDVLLAWLDPRVRMTER
jgi:oligopeptide transport system permease protein